jgi:hypothetical protein
MSAPRLLTPDSDEHFEAVVLLGEARLIAQQSTCSRARCGAVVATIYGRQQLVASGTNGPPGKSPARCRRKAELKPGFKSDRTCCIHAEQRALLALELWRSHDAAKLPAFEASMLRLYFVRLNNLDQIEPSGPPYCTICSKAALEAGITEWCLIHPAGVFVYDAIDYNERSFAYDGLVEGWTGPT